MSGVGPLEEAAEHGNNNTAETAATVQVYTQQLSKLRNEA